MRTQEKRQEEAMCDQEKRWIQHFSQWKKEPVFQDKIRRIHWHWDI